MDNNRIIRYLYGYRLIMKFRRKKEEVIEQGPSTDAKEALLTEIRDLLRNQKN